MHSRVGDHILIAEVEKCVKPISVRNVMAVPSKGVELAQANPDKKHMLGEGAVKFLIEPDKQKQDRYRTDLL